MSSESGDSATINYETPNFEGFTDGNADAGLSREDLETLVEFDGETAETARRLLRLDSSE